MPRICEHDGCNRKHYAKGMCESCYRRELRKPRLKPKLSAEERLWAKVKKTDTCWIWTGVPNSAGYGTISVNKRPMLTHRFAYELLVGEIPEGLQLDHQCHVLTCVNPNHLKPVDTKRNMENQLLAADNSSGYRGVYWSKKYRRWIGNVRHWGVNHHAGSFLTADDANDATVKLRNELFTNNILDPQVRP